MLSRFLLNVVLIDFEETNRCEDTTSDEHFCSVSQHRLPVLAVGVLEYSKVLCLIS